MKIAAAQISSLRADLEGNIAHHEQMIALATAHGAELLVFPELSLTQYDVHIVSDAATTLDDPRLLRFQAWAERSQMTICLGVPIRSEAGIIISMPIFQPGMPPQVYSKRYLHADEVPYFAPGAGGSLLPHVHGKVAFAICYELSVAEHAQEAAADGAAVYVASVAKTPSGVVKATERLAAIARDYGVTVFMSNCVGECDGSSGGGQSAVWNAQGARLAALDDRAEGLLLYDPAMPQTAPEVVYLAMPQNG